MRIYTKTGDDGTTGLFGAGRVPKNHPRVSLSGDVDELNSFLGLARAELRGSPARALEAVLEHIQHRLLRIGSQITTPLQSAASAKIPKIIPQDITWLETAIDRLSADLPELTQFILPDGCRAAALLHVARTVARRTERSMVAARAADVPVDPISLQYLNRLSDLLFTMARWVNVREGIAETAWDKTIQ